MTGRMPSRAPRYYGVAAAGRRGTPSGFAAGASRHPHRRFGRRRPHWQYCQAESRVTSHRHGHAGSSAPLIISGARRRSLSFRHSRASSLHRVWSRRRTVSLLQSRPAATVSVYAIRNECRSGGSVIKTINSLKHTKRMYRFKVLSERRHLKISSPN